jgi:hypothetical protein
MRILRYNESAAAVGARIGYIMSWDTLRSAGCLVEEHLAWLPYYLDMQGWRRGELPARETNGFHMFRYAGVLKSYGLAVPKMYST